MLLAEIPDWTGLVAIAASVATLITTIYYRMQVLRERSEKRSLENRLQETEFLFDQHRRQREDDRQQRKDERADANKRVAAIQELYDSIIKKVDGLQERHLQVCEDRAALKVEVAILKKRLEDQKTP